MKIAYLVSRYPAVSHTFIEHEIGALRARGHEISTFSVRRATNGDVLGPIATDEARRTRHLLPGNVLEYTGAIGWAFATRPLRTLRAMWEVVGSVDISSWQRMMWLFYFAEALVLARWLVQGGQHHLHCHFGNNGSNTGYLSSIVSGVPFSMTLHGIDLDQYEKFRLPKKISFSAFTVCISKFGKARMMQLCPPRDWAKLRVVHCGLPPFDHSNLPAPTDQGRLLCVARLSEEKGHLILFDALKLLVNAGLRFSCELVGDGPLRSVLEERVATLGLQDHIRFRGSLAPKEVCAAYSACDAVVLASFAEGIPLVLMEAMAHARPVVATRVGGIHELVEHGRTGLLASAGNAKDLAAAITELLRDPAHARAMGEAAAATVSTRFRLDTSAEMLESLFLASEK